MTTSATKRAFILDFDNTLTRKDTISALFSRVLEYQKLRGHDFTKAHADIISNYTTDYEAHIKEYQPVKKDRRTLKAEIDFQRSLKVVETRSFERISQSGIFKGISNGKWRRLGQEAVAEGEIEIRRGFWASGELGDSIRSKCSILSVNFSRPFIRGVVTDRPDNRLGHLRKIVSNYQKDPVGKDGTIVGPYLNEKEIMATSDDKLRVMNKMRLRWQAIDDVVYVGDSGTDIECLTDRNVTGVIMTPDGKGSLMETMSRIGIEVVHVSEFTKRDGLEQVLYWARDFVELFDSPLCKLDNRPSNRVVGYV
jgi:2-hydroxy-3-keto-5-methylthiopentenyl-1-phosphate phosphatase